MKWEDYILASKADFSLAAPAVLAFVVLAGLDLLTGLIRAFATKKVNSTASWVGTLKKVAVLVIIAGSSVLDPFVPNIPVTFLIAIGMAVPEFLSLVENCSRLGIKVPDWVRTAFSRLQQPPESLSKPEDAIVNHQNE